MSDGATLAIPRGFRASGSQGGIEGVGIARHGRAGRRSTVCGGRDIHDQPRLRRPGEVVPRAAARRRHPRHRDQLGQCQRRDRRARDWRTPGARRSEPPSFWVASLEQVLVASTGIIGHQLPMDKIEAGLAKAVAGLSASPEAFQTAAASIMTTDTRPKIVSQRQTIGGREVTLLGIAKGAAMIGPRMATMLGFLLTDAPLWANELQDILADAVEHSFNCLSVEGHASTNDTVLLLSSTATTEPILQGDDVAAFAAMVRSTCETLARAIADDGEGATHFITIDVEGCESFDDARAIARAVADSPLVKTAIHGADPNWGRIVSAAGYCGRGVPGGRALALDQRRRGLPGRHARFHSTTPELVADRSRSQARCRASASIQIRHRGGPILDV